MSGFLKRGRCWPPGFFPMAMFLVYLILSCPLEAQQLPEISRKIDPFYLKLFEEGLDAFNQGNFEEAFESLKISSFGFLDEPDLLSEAFVYLTLSAYNLKKTDQVEYYLREMSRFKLNNRIPGSRLPKEVKEQFARVQSKFKNSLTG